MHGGWPPSIDIHIVGTKSCDFELEFVFQNNDDAKMRTDCVSTRKYFLHIFRPRIGGDVDVFGRFTSNQITHRTTGEVGDVPAVTQTRDQFAGSSFYRWEVFSAAVETRS